MKEKYMSVGNNFEHMVQGITNEMMFLQEESAFYVNQDRFIDMTVDFAAKKMLRKELVLRGILSALLQEKVKKIIYFITRHIAVKRNIREKLC